MNPNIQQIQEGVPEAAIFPNRRAAGGLGNLLFHIHSTHFSSIFLATETTSLQFYEHVVVASVTSQLWCFPQRALTKVIPRFKIVDAQFSLGPRSIPRITWLLLLISIILIIIGAVWGGCKDKCHYSSCGVDSSACAMLVIGILVLLIPVPPLLLIPCIKKRHYMYLDVKAPSTTWFNFGGVTTYAFRFKKVGFDDAAGSKADFDDAHVLEYVYGPIAKAGDEVTNEAHLLSHLNYASLSTPIVPINAGDTVRNLFGSVSGSASGSVGGSVKHRKKNGNGGLSGSGQSHTMSV